MLEKIKSWLPLNFALVANPVNWVIVFLMLALAGVALALIAQSTNGNTNTTGEASE